jgi:hypothetical protein
MRRLYVPLVSFLFAPPSAGLAQDDPNATRGVYGSSPDGGYVRPGPNGGYVRLPSAVQDQPTAAQDDQNATRAVYGPGKNGVPLRQPTAIFPDRSPQPAQHLCMLALPTCGILSASMAARLSLAGPRARARHPIR